jgi:hypothetical protein
VVQYVLHVVNHVIDVNASDTGVANLVALAVIGLLLAWMLWAARVSEADLLRARGGA